MRVFEPGGAKVLDRRGRAPGRRWLRRDVLARRLGWYKVVYRWHRNYRSFLVRSVPCGEPEGLANNLDEGTVLFDLPAAAPGHPRSSCITVGYNGAIPLEVRMYGETGGTGLDAHLWIRVTRGSRDGTVPTSASCTGFVADGALYTASGPGVVFEGPLRDWPDDFEAGLADPAAEWRAGDRQTYRFTVWLPASTGNDAQGLTASQTFIWEGRA